MKFSLNLLDDEAQKFCEGIVSEMVSLFSIAVEEAITRVNIQWTHLESIGGNKELIYHEDETFWAQDIYIMGRIAFGGLTRKSALKRAYQSLFQRK